ncbi:MAG: SDR family oxidoreductase [Acidobacteria bacterium]|nr:SDR family oxidoreductase [Acidobacteriota bacterium]
MGVLDRFSLSGKVALVTAGAGPLFGKSISEALAEAGATLITASRSEEHNLAFAEQMRKRGYDAHGTSVDITNSESIEKLRAYVIEKFGRLDILVNNALARVGGDLETQTPKEWMYSAEGDMVGLFALCKTFLQPMLAQGKGSIINIASIYGVVASDPSLYEGTDMLHPPHYDFIKAGMINFTRYLATTYGRRGIRANCISPGGFFDNQPERFVQAYSKRVPIGRMLNNEDVKGAVVFLASDASEYVLGANLMVDGGWTII